MNDSFSVNNVDPYTPQYAPGRQNPEQERKKKKKAIPEAPNSDESDDVAENDVVDADKAAEEKVVGTQIDLEA